MTTNMGTIDRAIRILAAIVIAVLAANGVLTGVTAVVLGIVAGVLFITGVVGFCPLYALLHVSSYSKKG